MPATKVKHSLLKSFFSSGLQAIAVQVLGAVFFYVVSLNLPKEDFGVMSWYNALAMFITTALSFGLEQIVIRRIAASRTSDWAASAYLFHAVLSSLIAFAVLYAASLIIGQQKTLKLLPWFFCAQALVYIGTPFKSFLNAKERFTPYGVIAFTSNVLKIITAIWYITSNMLTIKDVVRILIGCSIFELAALAFYVLRRSDFHFDFKFAAYRKLIKEALPTYFTVIFNSSLSRMDWILLGVLGTKVATADYSFAYRAYEIATMPIMVIAPVILPKFARLLSQGNGLNREKRHQLNQFFSVEVFLAMCIPLCLNIIWTPWVGELTHGKYGLSNALQFFILSMCIPFQFFINLLWTINFANKKYNDILKIAILSAVTNLVLDIVLIPLYGSLGAAIAYMATVLVQTGGYYRLVQKSVMSFSLLPLFIFGLIGTGTYYLSVFVTDIIILRLCFALIVYTTLAVVFKQIGKRHINTVKLYMRR